MTLPSGSASSQHWNAAAYADDAHFVPALGQPVLDLLQPQPGERILDLGCGDGEPEKQLWGAPFPQRVDEYEEQD